MTIGRKLTTAIVTILAVGTGMAVSAFYSIKTISGELEASTGPTAEKLGLAGDLKAAADILRTGQRGILLNGLQHDPKGAEATKADYDTKKTNALAPGRQNRAAPGEPGGPPAGQSARCLLSPDCELVRRGKLSGSNSFL
jgi:hypothetical protein